MTVQLDDIRQAHERIRPHIHRTPVLTCQALDQRAKAALFFKCENFQKVGAFKMRGAANAVFSLAEADAPRGVVTHSSGNHAAALARAAARRGIPAYIVMPRTAPAIKQAAVAGYGGQITLCEPTQAAREATAAAIVQATGATMIHPYNDDRVIAGQGTAALELLDEVPDLDAVLAPVGGGGLLSGTALVVKALRPTAKVIGCEPALADDASQSLQHGYIVPARPPQSIADGLLTSLADRTFPIIQRCVDAIALAAEDEIRAAQRLVMERMKIVIEPSCAVPLAALLNRPLQLEGRRIGIILTGGNVDLARLF